MKIVPLEDNGTPWWFVNDNYDRRQARQDSVTRTRPKMGASAIWKDALQVIGYLVFYAGLGCLLAYGFCNVP